MVQYIKQGDIFGRIGENLGRGLAEQLPKAVERGRLSSALKSLGEQKDQTPFQQFTGLVGAAHEYPQVVATGGDLLKQQGIRQAYNRQRVQNDTNNPSQPIPKGPGFMEGPGMPSRGVTRNQANGDSEVVPSNEIGQPQIVEKNPLRPETATVKPMTPEEKIDDISRLGEQFQSLTYPELKAMSDENEQRRQAQPEAERAEDARQRGIQENLRNGFRTLLEQKLQKKGAETYSDITGEMENNLVRSMSRELRTTPGATEDDVINKWTQKGLELAKAKTKLEEKLGSSVFATPIVFNKSEYRKGIEDLSDVYRKSGNSEEFYNTLRSYGFSPRGAGSLAYKSNPNLAKYEQSAPKGKSGNSEFNNSNSRKIATQVEDLITSNDSILSIASTLMNKDPNFVLNEFLDQLREDKDQRAFSPRQLRELSEAGHLTPSWADILVLPWR